MQRVAIRLGTSHSEVDHRMWRHAKKQQLSDAKYQDVTRRARLAWQRFVNEPRENGIDLALVTEGREQQRREQGSITRRE